ncbi:MAG TPA: hypothetical protein VGV38_20410 [Pyrinomonadaceae bacterium]|nr:hypothetical protein [Pyrinomonadaceae bacterium]
MKCPYCQRRLRNGIRCTACQRYVLRWPHLALLVVLITAAALGALELLFRFI